MAARVRPARRARWRRYLPPALLAGLSIPVAAAPGPLIDPLLSIGFGATGARVVLAAGAVLVTVLAAYLVDRPPVVAFLVGALATSLGGNLFTGIWIGLPLAVAGLAWIGVLEVKRWLTGLTLAPRGLVLHRPLKRPWTLEYDDLNVVHTTPHGAGTGTLIFETEHGTVTAPHLPGVEDLRARLEARTDRLPVHPTVESLEATLERIEGVLGGRASP